MPLADLDDGTTPAWLLLLEFQAQHDPGKLQVVVLEALVALCHARDTQREGSPLLPLPVFVYLTGQCPQSSLTIRTPTGKGFSADVVLWEVGLDEASETLARVERGEWPWGALFWVSLMRGADLPEVGAWWQRLVLDKVPQKSRGDVAHIATVFAELSGCLLAWERNLGEKLMTESVVVNRILEQGEMRMGKETLRRFLRARLPEALTPDVEKAIADQPSLTLLREWIDAAYMARNADEFLAVLRR